MVSFTCSGSSVTSGVAVDVSVGVKVDMDVGDRRVSEGSGASACVGIVVEPTDTQLERPNTITKRRDKQCIGFMFEFFLFI